MTTLREAAQQALEALETVWPIIEGEKFKQECSYGGNFNESKTDRARKACVDSLAAIAALKAALAEQAQPLTDACTKLLQEALPHAEWQDKHIHPVGRESYQNWKVTVYLPVPLSEADKSPQAALARAVEAEVLKRMGVGK